MKIALGIEYNGTHFHGWQRQADLRTVQAELERALSKIAASPITTICAGRTDTGVHAKGQVVHFETEVARPDKAWVFGSNTILTNDVSVLWAKSVADHFNARFSATARHYRYTIINRRSRPAIEYNHATWVCQPLDETRMQQATHYFIGEHDFSSFRASQCQSKTPMRNVMQLQVLREQEYIYIDISANAFLHHMVRNIVGVLITIGMGKQPPAWANEVLQARDRTAADMTAPASGLYLMQVDYPAEFGI